MEHSSQETLTYNNRQEEYLSAQRAAVEALHVGRATLEQTETQGEQLEHADRLADETEYKLDRASRILRGMTWSGWVANMFTKEAGPPPDAASKSRRQPPATYENIPSICQPTAQAIQNYHANVQVLENCETDQQKDTCKLVCDDMYRIAQQEINHLQTVKQVQGYTEQFANDLSILRNRQEVSQQRMRNIHKNAKKEDAVVTNTHQPSSPLNDIKRQQDEHLDFIAQSLGELGSIAHSITHSVAKHNDTIERLDGKSETIYEKSKMNTRRADRIIQKKSWSPVKPTFHGHVIIRHIASGKYLSVVNAEVYLVPKVHPETCVFGMWKRQGEIFGLKNKFNDKWVGQNLFGSLDCSASYFGRKEEWESDSDWTNTPLLCASAGWGAGGYLMVRPNDFAVTIGGGHVEDKRRAALWHIMDYTE